jgi:hypothetical protein
VNQGNHAKEKHHNTMQDSITGKTAAVGETYYRVRYEVQSTNNTKGWTLNFSRNTLEEARKAALDMRKSYEENRWIMDMGDSSPVRIVKATSSCEVIEII